MPTKQTMKNKHETAYIHIRPNVPPGVSAGETFLCKIGSQNEAYIYSLECGEIVAIHRITALNEVHYLMKSGSGGRNSDYSMTCVENNCCACKWEILKVLSGDVFYCMTARGDVIHKFTPLHSEE